MDPRKVVVPVIVPVILGALLAAGAWTFLLGGEASYISGADIPVDGGMTAHGGVKSISEAART